MASSSDVVKKVTRFKLQLADTAESATVHAHGGGGGGSCSLWDTVLRILQKLKDLNITLEVLSETGIGKIVNSLRRHEKAGELAKSLVRGWKKLLPTSTKEGTSLTEDVSEVFSVKDKLDDQKCPDAGALTTEDLNNNCETSHSKSQDSSDEAFVKTGSKKEKQRCEEQKGKKKENPTKTEQVKQHIFQSDVLEKKTESDEMDDSFASKKNDQRDRKSRDGNKNPKEAHLKSRSDSREKLKINSDSGRFGSEKEPNKKLKKKSKESFSFESSDKYSKALKLTNVGDDESSGISRSSESRKRKRKKTSKERNPALNHEQESENKGCSKNKKAKIKPKDEGGRVDREEASKSFESFLNYDMNVSKKKERCGAKKPSKKLKNKVKEEATKHPDVKLFKLSVNGSPLKQRFQDSVMELMSIPLPASLPECEKPSCVDYVDIKVEKESDVCDVSEESAMFTGQRLNKKMQVYSGAKTVFLPAMLSLYQQCIRTLQNNIGMLHETGGVPFEILKPVLERCMPEQLLRIEECNPIYVGVTDHLWGKHCQRDFKHSRLQEYESWKEMYVRLSEERERKLQRLTKTIVSANSTKPKGRQVKMAFIHTVAKPPRDVRIQQEIHGTASQQPHPPRCSVKVEDNRLRPSCNEPSRPSSSSSGGSTTQDPRKKTKVAPMMAKSLKAFKKQLGRR